VGGQHHTLLRHRSASSKILFGTGYAGLGSVKYKAPYLGYKARYTDFYDKASFGRFVTLTGTLFRGIVRDLKALEL
jgi:hypothetical protein